jgi:DNA-binding GntR family transcriptional regulator
MTTEPLATLSSDTLADQAYRSIRAAIAKGELRPGQKVTERGLADQLSVSPTPVREALRRLGQDGLIERTGPRTVKVSVIGDAAIRDLAEVEVALRGMVARFAAKHATEAQLDHLDAILDEADDLLVLLKQRRLEGAPLDRHVSLMLDAMQRFNDATDSCANNPVLVRLLEQARVFSRPHRRARLLELIEADPEFSLDRYASHRELVRALRAGDSAAAESIAMERAQAGISDLITGGSRRTDVDS